MKRKATVIDGRSLAQRWSDDIAVEVRALDAPIGLAAVCVEGNAALRSFVKLKEKAAHEVGIQFSSYFIDPRDRTGAGELLRFLASDESVHGIFIELPLPHEWDDAGDILALIPPEKDVDALTLHPLVPAPAARALRYVLEAHDIATQGIVAVVVGHGRLVGRPIAQELRDAGATVHVIDIDTAEPAQRSSTADLIVTGVGKANLITSDWVKEGATVIDFGYADGHGDVDMDSVKQKAGLLTPVPGGMGPLVVAAVLENLVALAVR